MEGIIVGLDESPSAQAALRWAVEHGDRVERPVTAVMAWGYIDQHHLEPAAPFDPAYTSDTAAGVLDELVARAAGLPHRVGRLTVCDLPARALLDAGRGADLIVVGARGIGGFRGLLLGSVSRQVLHGATGPVSVVRDAARRSGSPIVVGVDGSAPSRRALDWAIGVARRSGDRIVAVHAWQPPIIGEGVGAPIPDAERLAGCAARFLHEQVAAADTSGLAIPIERRAVPDRAAAALVEASRLASLVVIGSRGHGQLARTVLGSVSDQVTHHAACPVVVIP